MNQTRTWPRYGAAPASLFRALAEELHFGRAAAHERILPSALSQQVQRLDGRARCAGMR
jgi:hypothetical protein